MSKVTQGTTLVDALIHSFLFGFVVSQALKYGSDYGRDSWKKRALVGIVVAFSVGQTILQYYKAWYILIDAHPTWGTSGLTWLDFTLNGVICSICQGFYIRRCWKLTQRNPWVLYPLATIHALAAIAWIGLVISMQLRYSATSDSAAMALSEISKVSFATWTLGSLVLDSAAAFTITHRLYTSRAGNKGSDSVVKDVIAVTWEAAILPAGCMFIAVVLYNQPNPRNLPVLLFALICGKLYAIGLLRTLNARDKLRARMKSQDLGRVSLGGWDWASASIMPPIERQPSFVSPNATLVQSTQMDTSCKRSISSPAGGWADLEKSSAASTSAMILPAAAEKRLLEKGEDGLPQHNVAAVQRQQRRSKRVLMHLKLFTVVLTCLLIYTATKRPPHKPFDAQRVRPRLSLEEREQIFLSVPNNESALEASRAYATHPHLAGAPEDFEDAKVILELFQTEFGIHAPHDEPIFPAGTRASQLSTRLLTSKLGPRHPTAWIDVYYPVMNTPLDRSLEILGDDGEVEWAADLVEDGDPADPEAAKYRDAVPTWHGLSKDGEATGQVIFAEYGRQEDYKALVKKGVDFTGKIVLTRYGGIFRGLKIKGAQELGAAAVLIYDDPRDDGYVTAENGYEVYPAGPARNPSSVQRGSVQYLSAYPGDPTTPGYPAYEDAERTEGENIPKIPSLPISYNNAKKLIEEIGEIYVEDDGVKSLSGKASEKKIKLVNHVDTKVTPIWNTMAAIPGHSRDEVVIIGCHRDAWVMGAADPTSGTVSLHEVIKGFGELYRQGWRPLRTLLFASWDAEEYGLIGSTEYGEDFADWLAKYAVAYINVDVSVAGSKWRASGSPSLAHLITKTAKDVEYNGSSLWDARKAVGPYGGPEELLAPEFVAATKENKLKASKTEIGPLGSGSDYTVFLQRLGIAATDQGFGNADGTDAPYHYHSIYDSQRWQELYADPGFHRHVAVAKHLGLLTLRIVDSIALPLNVTQYAYQLDDYLETVRALLPTSQVSADLKEFAELGAAIAKLQEASAALDKEKYEAEKAFLEALKKLPPFPPQSKCAKKRNSFLGKAAMWVKSVFGVPPPDVEAERDWVAWVYRQMEKFDEQGEQVHHHEHKEEQVDGKPEHHPHPHHEHDHHREHHHHDDQHHPKLPHFPLREFLKAARRVQVANHKVRSFERGFISEEGIPEREWYRHLGVAPGKWLGYGATTFPALTEAITFEEDEDRAAYEAARLTQKLLELADDIAV
ncbi:hypothetical protein K523DRAFT_413088 [Schizophyllum commune Tattone D]|nr:hypothetical protein K523DRAFT_413088 [Schizophyllum commune Tattone D]